MTNIFISYNPKVQAEQSLALRMQTLGALYGLSISLPDRVGVIGLKETTKQRIQRASLFIVFATRNLSRDVVREINYALELAKTIIVVYDKDVKNNLNIKGVHEIEYNQKTDSPEKIIKEINKIISNSKTKVQKSKADNDDDDTIGAFLLIGLGLLLLGALTSKSK
ncbi:hypothetical protein PDL71_17950 [Lacibacter sp. MH-610]|uniref:hypothetical protein n=1 Tax=Lacibacter sp. MH-610 TaxID=3020883 RepID=UPI003892BB8C